MPHNHAIRCLCLALWLLIPAHGDRPNIVLIMTDDQGYGDFGVTGNPVIHTPHLDRLARGSASMSRFYVSPVCSPTRASLMTGRYNYRTRVVDTWVGRSMMDTDEVTIAEALRDAGYATGIFGKWHLGDCYPMRPSDQGFDESLVHKGGGLAQPAVFDATVVLYKPIAGKVTLKLGPHSKTLEFANPTARIVFENFAAAPGDADVYCEVVDAAGKPVAPHSVVIEPVTTIP